MLDREVKQIKFSEHLNVPQDYFMALVTPKNDKTYMIKLDERLEEMMIMDLVFTNFSDFVIFGKKHLFLGVKLKTRNTTTTGSRTHSDPSPDEDLIKFESCDVGEKTRKLFYLWDE